MDASCWTDQPSDWVGDTSAVLGSSGCNLRDLAGLPGGCGSQVLLLSVFLCSRAPCSLHPPLPAHPHSFPNLPQRPLRTHRGGHTKTLVGQHVAVA